MIKITIAAEGEKVLDSFDKHKTNLIEVAATVLRLEQIKLELLSIKFDSDIEFSKNGN